MAEWLRRGLQILARRFDSGSGLHFLYIPILIHAPQVLVGGVSGRLPRPVRSIELFLSCPVHPLAVATAHGGGGNERGDKPGETWNSPALA